MIKLVENTVHAAKEKHVPALEKTEDGVKVKVGENGLGISFGRVADITAFGIADCWYFSRQKKVAEGLAK